MHLPTDSTSKLAYVLAKIKGLKYSETNPVRYSTTDIQKAKGILQRLLQDAETCEVASIKEVAIINNEE